MAERRKDDAYYTPWDAVELIKPHLPAGWETMRLLEPCCGNGAILRALGRLDDKVTALDIRPEAIEELPPGPRRKVCDFTTFHSWTKWPLIMTNPPFVHPLQIEVVGKALSLLAPGGNAFIFLKLAFFESDRRESFNLKHPIFRLFPLLGKRVSFTEDGKTDNACYGWFNWRKDDKGRFVTGGVRYLTRLDLGTKKN
jgi:hypothetical protein